MTLVEKLRDKNERLCKHKNNNIEYSIEQIAIDLIEDYILPKMNLEMFLDNYTDRFNNQKRQILSVQFSRDIETLSWYADSISESSKLNIETEVLVEAVKIAEKYNLIGIDRASQEQHIIFVMLLVEESEITSDYIRKKYLNK